MDDQEAILKRVQAALEHEAHIDMQDPPIRLDATEQGLMLEGEVPSVGTKKRALKAASRVDGVERVIDRIRVVSGEPIGDGATRDAVVKLLLRDIDFQNCGIRVRAKGEVETLREPMGDPAYCCGDIEIGVEDGVVTLRGRVISLSHKRVAGVLAWWARGTRDVVNEIEVVPNERDNDEEVTEALRLIFETDPHVHADHIAIRSHDFAVTLEGVVASEVERKRAEHDAWCVFGVNDVVNRIEVR